MKVQIRRHPTKKGFFTVTPLGASIDAETHDLFRNQIQPYLVRSTRAIIMDFRNVEYVSSAGFGVLFSVHKALRENGGELLFLNVKPPVLKLFEIIRILPSMTVFKSTEEVDEYLRQILRQHPQNEDPAAP